MKIFSNVFTGRALVAPALAVVVAVALGWSQPAKADGFYVAGSGLLLYAPDSDVDQAAPVNADIEWDNPGFGLNLALGYGFMDNFRVELEGGYKDVDTDKFSVFGTDFDLNGDAKIWSLMANAYVDFDAGGGFKPYIGAGLGIAEHKFDATPVAVGGVPIDDDDTVFAYQAMAGIAYEVDPQVDIYIGYRYFGHTDADVKDANGTKGEIGFNSHSAELGVRFHF